jgi:hypothetical protein
MVIRLIKSLLPLIASGRSFYLYLDNLFVYWRLSQYFKERGIELTGICRKGVYGYPPRLLALKRVPTSLN